VASDQGSQANRDSVSDLVSIFFFLGGLMAVGIRLELTTPEGDFVTADTYNKMFTLHGVIMVFFFLIPSIPAVLGNFLIPIMIGAKDLAFPKINLLSYYIYAVGGIFVLSAIAMGGVDTGWTFYTPYSSSASNTNVVPTALGIFITGFSSILTGPQLHRHDSPHARAGHDLVPAAAVHLGALRRQPDSGARHAGHRHHRADGVRRARLRLRHLRSGARRRPGAVPAPVLVLFASGRLHHDSAGDGRHERAGRQFLAEEDLRLQLRGVLEPRDRRLRLHRLGAPHVRVGHLGLCRHGVLVPELLGGDSLRGQGVQLDRDALQGLHLVRDADAVRLRLPRAFAIGGLTGLFLATLGTDVHLHDTYFVVAHFHYIMVGGAIMGYLGGLHFWWPKIVGPDVFRVLLAHQRHSGVRRLQPDVLPAVRRRLPRHAAPVPRLSGRIPGAERAVVGRGVGARASATCCPCCTSSIR
jgi:cytochrome c oxidase subunit I